jgi:hypothetical protein
MGRKRLIQAGGLAVIAACLLLALPGCRGSAGIPLGGNFKIAFNGFHDQIGKTFYLNIVEASTGHLVAWSTPVTIQTEGFFFAYPGVIEDGHSYNVNFWVDTDNNGQLDHSPNGSPPGVDESWRVTATGTPAGLSLSFHANTDWMDITPFWPEGMVH